MKTIAIVGAGFCGTTLAVHLLRRPPVKPLQVLLINRSGLLARGVAYGTRTAAHVLNVPAGRMGALPGEEHGFYEFARRHDPRITPGSFVARRSYGDYLESLLADAASHASHGCRFRAMVGDVHRVLPRSDAAGARLLIGNGDVVDADRVVLSVGNYAPQDPPIAPAQRAFYSSPRYVRDPWRPDALWVVKSNEPVLLIGSGLSMLDVVLDLRDRGHHAPIYAVSRRGLMPQPHRDLDLPPRYDEQLPRRLFAQPSARRYARLVREAVARHLRDGGDWRDVIGALRISRIQSERIASGGIHQRGCGFAEGRIVSGIAKVPLKLNADDFNLHRRQRWPLEAINRPQTLRRYRHPKVQAAKQEDWNGFRKLKSWQAAGTASPHQADCK